MTDREDDLGVPRADRQRALALFGALGLAFVLGAFVMFLFIERPWLTPEEKAAQDPAVNCVERVEDPDRTGAD